eukprot:gb/GECG01013189.1/.p1 GENE.gb/GECG01013189.1/~~gb/GECG01013189.1/.p1  ORF type:complete len:249 (+),score=24.99 gb/GECG01013189.1/:1-747(+)
MKEQECVVVSHIELEHDKGEFLVIHHSPHTREYVLRSKDAHNRSILRWCLPAFVLALVITRATQLLVSLEACRHHSSSFIPTIGAILELAMPYAFVGLNALFAPEVVFGLLVVGGIVYHDNKQVVEESVLVIRELGVQLQSVAADGSVSKNFLERRLIRAAIINEGYRLLRIHFYLAFLMDHQEELEMAFNSFIPRLPILRMVYQGIQHILFYHNDRKPLSQQQYNNELTRDVEHHKNWLKRLRIARI